MKELFTPDGHLTDEGLDAVIEQTLNEMQRLETAEHLSFCDECIIRYTELMESAVLLQPEKNLPKSVKEKLRNKLVRFSLRKYGSAAAAVAFALIIGGTGVFSSELDFVPKNENVQPQNSILVNISATISGLFKRDSLVIPKLPEVNIPVPQKVDTPEKPKADKDSAKPEAQKQKINFENPAKAIANAENPAKKAAIPDKLANYFQAN